MWTLFIFCKRSLKDALCSVLKFSNINICNPLKFAVLCGRIAGIDSLLSPRVACSCRDAFCSRIVYLSCDPVSAAVSAVICRRTPEAVECVANVVAEQCGGEIAGHIRQLLSFVLQEGDCRMFTVSRLLLLF